MLRYTFIVSAILLLSSPLLSQDRIAKLDSLFTTLHRENKFSGNVLIAEKGVPVFQKSYGLAFREKGEALNSESIFELASVGKQFTAMAIMILKHRKMLNYTDTLRKFFPELPYRNITIRQMLNHTSGLPDYIEIGEPSAGNWDFTKIMTNKDMIDLLVKMKPPVNFAPGEKWEYSNTAYALLGSIVEKVSGSSFRDFMAENIYKPLGMNRTLVYHKRLEGRLLDNYAYGYVFDSKRKDYVMADSSEYAGLVYALDGIYGDGLTNSTTTDLLKWDQSFYSEKLLPKAELAEAFTPAPLNGGRTFDYGFGWLLRDTKEFGMIINHGGAWPGYSTWVERHPRDNKTIIILANAGSAIGKIGSVRNILYGLSDEPPAAVKVSQKLLKQYVGNYKMTEKDTIKIALEGGRLVGSGAGQKKHVLYAERKNLFFRKDASYKTEFVTDEKGNVVMLRILREGPSIDAPRAK